MKNKIKELSSSKGLYQSILTVFGGMGATAISAVAMIIISRNLGPVKFGEFSVGFSLLLILNKINDLGFSLALLRFIPQSKNITHKNKLFSYSIKIKLVVAILIAIIGSLFTPYFSSLISFENTTIIYFTFILNIFTVLYEQLLVMLQSLHRFLEAVIAAAIQAITKLSSAIILIFFFSKNELFAFFTYVFAPATTLLFSLKLLPQNIKINLNGNFIKEKDTLWNMASHSAVGFIALGVIDNIDILFVQKYLNPFETGLLGGASRIAMLFSLAAYSLSTVLNSRVARYQDKNNLKKYTKKAIVLSFAIIVTYFLLLPFTKYAILYTIGPDYLESNNILNILLGSSFITILTTPFVAILFALKKTEWYFSLSGIIQLLIILIGNLIFVPIFGLDGTAWVRVTAKFVLLVLTLTTIIYMIKKDYYINSVKK